MKTVFAALLILVSASVARAQYENLPLLRFDYTTFREIHSNLYPQNEKWKVALAWKHIARSPDIDIRSERLPVSVAEAVSLAEQAVKEKQWVFCDDLHVVGVKLELPRYEGHVKGFYVVSLDGPYLGHPIELRAVVLMTKVVLLPEREELPNQRPEANAGRESVSPSAPGPGVAHP